MTFGPRPHFGPRKCGPTSGTQPTTRKNKTLDFMVDRQQIIDFAWYDNFHYTETEIIYIGQLLYDVVKLSLHDQENCVFNLAIWNEIYTDTIMNYPEKLFNEEPQQKPQANDAYFLDQNAYPTTVEIAPPPPEQSTTNFTFEPSTMQFDDEYNQKYFSNEFGFNSFQ